MYVSIRDDLLQNGEFSSPLEGLRHLGIEAVEVALSPEFQVSAIEVQDYPFGATFEMVRDTESDAAIEEALSGFGFEQHTLDDGAELWISDELGLMVFLFFTTPDGRSYTYRIVRFEVAGEDEISL